MSERRRHLLVLLIVLGLIAGSAAAILTQATKLGLDLQGGVQLIYQGKPTKQTKVTAESLQRALDIMRDRVDAFGVAEPELARHGQGPDRGQPPGRQGRRARRQAGRLDRPALLLRLGEERPRRELQDQRDRDQRRPAARHRPLQRGQAGGQVQDRGRRRTARPRPPRASTSSTRSPRSRSTTGCPTTSRADALDGLDAAQKERAEVIEVKPGRARPARREGLGQGGRRPDRWWIIRDDPGLSGTDIKNPEQNFDQRGGNEPIVTFDFSDKGRKAFQTITARVAQRGADNANPLNPDPQSELAALRDRARQRARLDPVHQLPREPRRHRRLDRRADLRRVHDHERPGPRARCSRPAPCRCGSS